VQRPVAHARDRRRKRVIAWWCVTWEAELEGRVLSAADRGLIKNVVGQSKFGKQVCEWLTHEALQAPGLLWRRSKTVLPPASRGSREGFVGD
jgi:hypothetical protein